MPTTSKHEHLGYEYTTTWGRYYWGDDRQPGPPDGEEWELVSSAMDDGMIVWTWRR